jgi:hypothetical protein
LLPNSAVGFAATCRLFATSQPFTPLPAMLDGFNVLAGCSATLHAEDTITLRVYQLTYFATQGTVAMPDYVERQMTVQLRSKPRGEHENLCVYKECARNGV